MEELTKTIKLYMFFTTNQVYVGKMGEKDEDGYRIIDDPVLVVPTQTGGLSYVTPVGMADKKLEPVHVKNLDAYYQITRPDMIQNYIKHVTNLIIAV